MRQRVAWMGLIVALAAVGVGFGAVPGVAVAQEGPEGGWRYCTTCGALVAGKGRCVGGAEHAMHMGQEYWVDKAHTFADGQGGWFKCKECLGLVHSSNSGRCPASQNEGPHVLEGMEYRFLSDRPIPETQSDWRYCGKCGMLHFGGNASAGRCPKGDKHALEGFNYNVRTTRGNDCPPGMVVDAELCYPPCPAGWQAKGPLCWEDCPAGEKYNDDGLTCRRDPVSHIKTSYPRQMFNNVLNAGSSQCEAAAKNLPKEQYPLPGPRGELCEQWGLGAGAPAYPRCADGYAAQGVFCTQQRCPPGADWQDLGPTCLVNAKVIGKQAKGRGIGVPKLSAARALAVVGDVACAMLAPGICQIVKTLKKWINDDERNAMFGRITGALSGLGDSFKEVLLDTTPENAWTKAGEFFDRTRNSLTALLTELTPDIFPGVDTLVRTGVGTGLAGAFTPVATALALIHFGVKKVMNWLLPKLIFETGNVWNGMPTGAHAAAGDAGAQKANRDSDVMLDMIFSVVKTLFNTGFGVMANLVKPEKKEKLKAGIERALGVAERIQAASQRAIAIARQGSGGGATSDKGLDNLLDLEAAIKSDPAPIVEALMEFMIEEVWLALDSPLRSLMGRVVGLLGKALDIPRNALVGAVGTIPFVGGVLSAALNFGLGLIVDKITGGITDFLMELAQEIVKDALYDLGDQLQDQLSDKQPDASKNRAGFAGFLGFVKTITNEVTENLRNLKETMKQNMAQVIAGGVGSLGGIAMGEVLSKLSIDKKLKDALKATWDRAQRAVGTLAAKQPDAKDVVSNVALVGVPFGDYLIELLPVEAPLKRMLLAAHAKVVDLLQDVTALSPLGVLSGLAGIVGGYLKEKLSEVLASESVAPERSLLADVVDTIVATLADPAKLFPRGKPDGAAILGKVADLAKPYLQTRLEGLVAGLGLEPLVKLAVDALLGADGPVRKGAAFFTGFPALVKQKGLVMLGDVVVALKTFAGRQVENAAGGRVSGALVEGLLDALGGALKDGSLMNGGADKVLQLAQRAFAPLLGSLFGGGSAAGPRRARDALVRACADDEGVGGLVAAVSGPVMALLQNPQRLKTETGKVVVELAGALAKGLRGLVKNAVLGLGIEEGLKPFVAGVLDGVFDLLSDPKELPKFRGPQAVAALQKGAAKLLPFLKGKLVEATPAPARELVSALADDLIAAVKTPESLQALIGGKAKDYLARAARVLGPPLVKLLLSALPQPAQPPFRALFDELQKGLANPAALVGVVKEQAAALAKKLVDLVKPVLQTLLAAVAGAAGVAPATLTTALQTVLAAAADPRGAAAAARTQAALALDQKLLPLAIRIEHAPTRDFVLGSLALLRELVADATAKGVRNNASALWQRASDLGARFAVSLLMDALPAGEPRQLVLGAVRGVAELFADPVAFGRTLAGDALTLLRGAAARLGDLLQAAVREKVADPTVAMLLGGAVRAGFTLLSDPQQWRALATEGITVLLGLVTPHVQRFVTAAIAQVGRVTGELRSFVDSFVRSIGALLSDARQRLELAKNPAVALVRAGFDGLKGFLVALLSRSSGGALVAPIFAKAVDALVALVLDASARDKFFRLNAAKAFAAVAPEGVELAKRLLAGALGKREPELFTLVQSLLTTSVATLSAVLEQPARLGDKVKDALAKGIIPAAKTFLAAQVGKLLARAPAVVRGLVANAFDAVATFASDMILGVRKTTDAVAAGGKALVGPLVTWALSFVTKEVERTLAAEPELRAFVTALLATVGDLVADPERLVAAAQRAAQQRDPLPVLQLALPPLAAAVGPLLEAKLVSPLPAGLFQTLGRFSVAELLALLRKPKDLVDVVKETAAGAWAKLKPRLFGLASRFVAALGRDGDDTAKKVAGGMQLVLASLGGAGGGAAAAGANAGADAAAGAVNAAAGLLPSFTIPARPAGTMRIASATFGRNLRQPLDNAKQKFVRECDRKARCRFNLRFLPDPAPGRPKDFSVEWSCGGRRRRVALTASTSTDRKVFLSCNPKEADLEESPGAAAGQLATAVRAYGRSWYHCKKCGGLVHWAMSELRATKRCAAGGNHENAGSREYFVTTESPTAEGQEGWGKCGKCKALTHASVGGVCTHGGAHEHDPATTFRLTYGGVRANTQDQWRFCRKCSMLHHGPTGGRCPQGGKHEVGDWNYNVRTK